MLSDANATKCKKSLPLKKNRMRPLFIALILVSISISCQKSKENSSICFTRTQTELIIKNNTGQAYYFVAFGQNILPLIDWAPFCGNNEVASNSSIGKQLSSVTGYIDSDLLVVYWWECTGTSPGQVHSVVLDRNQTACE